MSKPWQPPDSTAFNPAVSGPIYPDSQPKKKPKIHLKTQKQQPIKEGGKIKEANPIFCNEKERIETQLEIKKPVAGDDDDDEARMNWTLRVAYIKRSDMLYHQEGICSQCISKLCADQNILIANLKVIINRIGVSDIQGRIKQHKLSSPAKAKALRRPLRMFEKQAFGFIIINRNQAKSNNLSGYLY
ncbi:hypothetical protein NC652_036509 [Populus alba x Populus x berolinensis]|nr:hypothetical protein NC652_036509 [Populus alba x Populus x berolinensis]